MSKATGIQWCDSTVNGTTGCDGCELWPGPCFAGHYHESRMAKALPVLYASDFTEVRLAPGRLAKTAGWSDLTGADRPDKPWLNGMPRLIFVNDLGDLFSKAVPFEYIRDEVIATAASVKGSRHIYMLLTKRPRRLVQFRDWLAAQGIGWPTNVWSGTSVTGKASVGRIRDLLPMPGVRFVSIEPLVEDIGFPDSIFAYEDHGSTQHYKRLRPIEGMEPIDLLIVGGESDQGQHKARRFDLGWARKFIRVTRDTPIKVFVKQLGSQAIDEKNGIAGATLPVSADAVGLISRRLKDHHGGDWTEWPEDLRVREMPALQGVAS